MADEPTLDEKADIVKHVAPNLIDAAYSVIQAGAEASQEVVDQRFAVAHHLLWLMGDRRGFRPGSFTEHLIRAFEVADPANTSRLSLAFPVYGQGVMISTHRGRDALAEWGDRK